MKEVTIIGVDLAKSVFQLHGASDDGSVVFRKKLSRPQFHKFMASQPSCVVAMEACGGAHFWAREMKVIGHSVKLVSPRYVKPFVKRQKNDAADAEAIVEAAQRPTMRFVEPKSEEQQSRAVAFRVRQQFIHQRSDFVNALRSHLYEFGYIAPKGINHLHKLEAIISDECSDLPVTAREMCKLLLEQIHQLSKNIALLNKEIDALSKRSPISKRLQTMPGVGPICSLAIETFAPTMESFRCGRDFAAWLGLVPLQNSSGGKQRLGRTSKMGQRDIRRLLIVGAMAVAQWASRKGAPEGSWLARMLERKPLMLVVMALANKMARGIWAMLTKEQDYRDPMVAAA